MCKKILIIGMMGCGKTTVGQILAHKMKLDFYDMDKYIVKTNKMKISEIFEISEQYFRELETKACIELSKLDNVVISSGGGIVLNPFNMELFKDFTIVYINRHKKLILQTISEKNRPLLKNGTNAFYHQYEVRLPLYNKYKDIEVISNTTAEHCARKILKEIKKMDKEKKKKILVINGVNLNFLGIREPDIYGKETLEDIEKYIIDKFKDEDVELIFFQSNIEGEIVNEIQKAHLNGYDGVVINAGAHTHYSYAIADAIKGITPKVVEVHISNLHKREEFRHKSVLAPVVQGQILGFGKMGYVLAIQALLEN